MLDTIVRGGQVVDGTGTPRRNADVAISDGRIVGIGKSTERAYQVIDATGMVVAPGFIDVHTHLDVQGFWDTTLSPSPLHGVTTVVGGNCGFTVAPLTEADAAYMMRMLARVEGMPLAALERSVPWDWTSTGEFLARLEGRLSINAGFMVGHSAIRRVAMGEDSTSRRATESELDLMKSLLRDGLDAGALGFSSTKSESHNDAEGRPVPSRLAGDDEFVELASLCRDYPGTSLEFLPAIGTSFDQATIELMTQLSVAAQRPLNWNLLIVNADNVDQSEFRLTASDHAQRHGGKVVALFMPQRSHSRLNFLSGFGLDILPGWGEMVVLPAAEKLRVLADPKERRRLDELSRSAPIDRRNWGSRCIVETFTPGTKRYEGRRVSDIAADESKSPLDALLDIVCADGLRTTFSVYGTDSRADWEARARYLRDPRVVVGGSDAGAHLDMMGTFNYPTFLLQHAVREEGLLTLEESVRLLTQVPSALYGIEGRGLIRDGACADLVIFDEEEVGTRPLTTRFDLPTGAPRLFAEASGIGKVLVNGQIIVDNGEFTDARPGAILRAGIDTVTPSLR